MQDDGLIDRFMFLGVVAYARHQTNNAMRSYNQLRDRIPALDYDESDPYEREAVNVFYNDIEDTGLGARMQKITDSVNELFNNMAQSVFDVDSTAPTIVNDDDAYARACEQFKEIMDLWGPTSNECQEVFDRLLVLIAKKDRGETC
jgi:acetolactate synthase small subunit